MKKQNIKYIFAYFESENNVSEQYFSKLPFVPVEIETPWSNDSSGLVYMVDLDNTVQVAEPFVPTTRL